MLIFGKPEEEDSPITCPIGDDHAVPARSSLSLPGDALFDQATAEIGIDQTAFSSSDCLKQTGIRNAVLPGEPREPPGLEDLHEIN